MRRSKRNFQTSATAPSQPHQNVDAPPNTNASDGHPLVNVSAGQRHTSDTQPRIYLGISSALNSGEIA
jgi:hypothetical protein